jgi:putative sigma-54 modulation protein
MHITITGVHIDITDAIREYVNERLGSLSKYVHKGDTSATINVELSRTTAHHAHGDVFQAEAQVHVKGVFVNVKVVKDDLYAAIDEVRDMVARELTQQKDKRISVFKRGAQRLKKLLKFQNE